MQDFVDQANNLIAQGTCSIRHGGTERAREAEAELKQVRQAYAEAEQEYADLKQRYAAALEKLETAERTIEELRARVRRPSREAFKRQGHRIQADWRELSSSVKLYCRREPTSSRGAAIKFLNFVAVAGDGS